MLLVVVRHMYCRAQKPVGLYKTSLERFPSPVETQAGTFRSKERFLHIGSLGFSINR